MVFWIIAVSLMALCVLAVLALALIRGGSDQAQAPADYDLRIYRDQLSEVDRDVARGVLDEADAERVKTEISRRILAADAAAQTERTTSKRGTSDWIALAGLALVLLAGSGWLYSQIGAPGYGDLALEDRKEIAQEFADNRPSQAVAEGSIDKNTLPPAPNPSPDYVALVGQLRTVVAARPDDSEGLRLLAISERNLGNFSEAHQAFARYVDLRGPEASAAEFSDLADMMILAAGGYVSPEAQAALEQALSREPGNAPARYYWGLMMQQTGRPDIAFRTWDSLLRESPADAPWVQPILAQIQDVAVRAGEMAYTPPQPGVSGISGPSAADIEAAGEMSVSERMEMIEGMVAGLSDTLATEGGPPEKWAQLITALGVLGRTDQAMAVFQNAQQVFGENPGAMDLINRAGERAGVN